MQSMDTSVYVKTKNGERSALYFKPFCGSFFRQSTLIYDSIRIGGTGRKAFKYDNIQQ